MSTTQTESEPAAMMLMPRPWVRGALAALCAALLAWCVGMVALTVAHHRWADLAVVVAGTVLVAMAAWELRPGRWQR